MEKFDGSVKIAALDGTNYDNWKFRMEMLLTARKIFGYATGEIQLEDGADNAAQAAFKEKDNEARAIISMHVSDSQLIHVRNCRTAAGAWKTLKDQFQRKSLVRRIDLRDKISYTRMQEGDNALEFLDKICRLRDQLLEMGGTMSEQVFCEIVLGKLPSSYNSLRTTLDTLGEDKLSWEKVKGLILTVADRSAIAEGGMSENVLAVGKFTQNPRAKRPQTAETRKCFNCNKPGHLSKDCWSKPQNQKARGRGRGNNGNRKASADNTVQTLMISDALSVGTDNQQTWIIDSGATQHMTSSETDMVQYEEFQNPKKVYLANNQQIDVKGHGSIIMKCKLPNNEHKNIKFEKVLHVPELKRNLISVSTITENGGMVTFDGEKCEISKGNGILAIGQREGNAFILDTENEIICSEANIAKSENKKTLELWHLRLGHLGYDNVKMMSEKEIVHGMKTESSEFNRDCEGCALGKQTRDPFSKKGTEPAAEILDLVHSDVCGPMQITSDGGAKYILTFIDDKSRYTVVYFLEKKSEVLSKFKQYIQMAENFTERKLKRIRSDNGGEYTSNDFENFCKQRGIIHELTVARTPQHNGVAERMNRTLLESARSMLFHAKIPLRFWADAVNTAAYLRNRCPTSVLKGHTPHEIWFGKKPIISHLKVFGCNGYVHIPKENRKKLDMKSQRCIFLGYADNCYGYRMYNPITKKITVSRDVKFNENDFQNADNELIRMESVDVYLNFEKDFNMIYPAEENEADAEEPNQPEQPAQCMQPVGENENNIRRSLRERKQPDRYGKWINGDQLIFEDESNDEENNENDTVLSAVSTLSVQEPKGMREAWTGQNAKEWKKATNAEYNSLLKNETWTLVPLPTKKNVVGSKWVFKHKYGPDGTINRYKARFVAQGFSQKYGLDYEEVFAPVARANSLRTILAIANAMDMEVHQMDVKTAFLNGKLTEEIYMQQPEGYVDQKHPDYVCKLHKSLYGLKQSARCWNNVIDEYFKDHGYIQNKADQCVYIKNIIKNQKKSTMIIFLHVDDIIMACNDKEMMKNEKKEMEKKFEMQDLAHHILGMNISRKRKEHMLRISQRNYLEKVLERFQMKDCKPVATPIEPNNTLTKLKAEETPMNLTDYQAAVGCLTYAMTMTRPDLATALGILGNFLSNPGQEHWKALKRVLRYIKGTLDVGLEFNASNQTAVNVTGFTDADWGADVTERKSTSGYTFTVCGGLVSWRSKRQEIVALSSTEAEYIALSLAAQEVVWLKSFVKDLGYNQENYVLYEDNQCAIALTKNPENHARTKHIDIRYHFVRDLVQKKEIEVDYCPTTDMLADIMTKGLSRPRFQDLCNKLGIIAEQ